MESSKNYLDRTVRQIQKLRQKKRNLLVVSDFHLSEGFCRESGGWAINEDFFSDASFARFLQFAERRRARYGGEPWRLICNGDIFDFRQVGVPRNGQSAPGVEATRVKESTRAGDGSGSLTESEKRYGPGTSRLMSGLRVDLIYEGHRGFFQALAWFVACGNELVFIKGNHDVELHWPKTQYGIKRQLVTAYAEARSGGLYDLDWQGMPESFGRAELDRVFFLPWNYYEPGRVYIEHGQQFHCTDSQRHVLWPRLPWDDDALELSLGELFGRYFVTQLEAMFPPIDNIKPFSKGLSFLLSRGIPLLLARRNLWNGLKELWRQFRHAVRGALQIFVKSRRHDDDFSGFDRERQAELEDYGHHIDLSADCARSLDALKSTPQLYSKRFVWEFAVLPLLKGLGGLALVVAAWAALWLGLGVDAALAALVVLGAGVLWGTWQLRIKMVRPEQYLLDKAAQIHRVLDEHDKGVKYVIVGHDHHAHLQRLDTDPAYAGTLPEKPCYYVNSGTWTAVVSYEKELVPAGRQFPFVRVIGQSAHLMRWNDGGGGWEPAV